MIGNTSLALLENIPQRYSHAMGNLWHLAELRKKLGLTQSVLAERVGVEQPTVQRWEAGKREPDLGQLIRLASELGVEPGALLSPLREVPIGPRLFVKGEVAAGLWKVAWEAPPEEWQAFSGRADVNAEARHRFGLRVVGDSMDLVYPAGTIVECVSVFGHIEPSPGKRVVVIRHNHDGECEATVKELVERDGELWAVPRSSNPSHVAFNLAEPGPGITEVRIAAVVVASVRPE